MFAITETAIPGLHAIRFALRGDARGSFVKTFHAGRFAEAGLPTDFREMYYSVSTRDVLRGFHFQVPPAQHAKLVTCAEGRVLDVVVDLRRASPTFGQTVARELDGTDPSGFVIPAGCGHAFLTLSQQAMLVYCVTSVHAPEHDRGIAFDSVGFDWPVANPILSDRDRAFPSLTELETPF